MPQRWLLLLTFLLLSGVTAFAQSGATPLAAAAPVQRIVRFKLVARGWNT
jgi:hypothetical protein